jgi:hypothetical protein
MYTLIELAFYSNRKYIKFVSLATKCYEPKENLSHFREKRKGGILSNRYYEADQAMFYFVHSAAKTRGYKNFWIISSETDALLSSLMLFKTILEWKTILDFP